MKTTDLFTASVTRGVLLMGFLCLFNQCKKETTPEPSKLCEAGGMLNLSNAAVDGGYAYTLNVDLKTVGDSFAQPTVSTVKIFEDGIELSQTHSSHQDIRELGKGRFSYWGTKLYLSASDNSNPITNGKKYSYCVVDLIP